MRPLTLLAAIAGLLACAIALVLGIIVPTVRTIVAFHDATVAEYASLEHRYRAGRILTRVLRDYTLIRDDVANMRSTIPQERDVLGVVRGIETIAAAHRLEESVAIERNATTSLGASIARVPMTLELAGRYPDILAALRDLERLPAPPIAETITLTATGGGSSDPHAPATRVQLVARGALLWRTEDQR